MLHLVVFFINFVTSCSFFYIKICLCKFWIYFWLFQVSLFCLAIGQDPKNLPIAIVNAENDGAHCFLPPAIDNITYQCPITFGWGGLPEQNKHLVNFTCRYMSFVGKIMLLRYHQRFFCLSWAWNHIGICILEV